MIFGRNHRSHNDPFTYKLFSNTYWREKLKKALAWEKDLRSNLKKKKKKEVHNAQCHLIRSFQTKDGRSAWWWTLMSISGLLSWVMSWQWLLALSVRYCGQCMPVSDIAMEIQHCSTKTKLLGWVGFPWSSCQLNCEELIL